jgi:hypothetical protein
MSAEPPFDPSDAALIMNLLMDLHATPEEIAHSRDIQTRVRERLLYHEQQREDALALHEGREPRRLTSEMLPPVEE